MRKVIKCATINVDLSISPLRSGSIPFIYLDTMLSSKHKHKRVIFSLLPAWYHCIVVSFIHTQDAFGLNN